MQFSARLSFFLLGFVLIVVLPHSAKGQVSSPRRFRLKVLGQDKLEISWKEPKGDFDGYKVTYATRRGGQQKVVELAKQETKLVIRDFDPSKDYYFKITAVNQGEESKPLQGKHEAQGSGSETAQTQGGKKIDVTRENNEISEERLNFV
uniref:Collagen alpha-1(XIV) chain-like n=1 Tax=Fundulus heteroclitus TaxID=8078 RepID=A0A3Q2PGZ4_FUNHE